VTIVIAGGGLSGLSLAGHLALESEVDDEVVVVDDGSRQLARLAVEVEGEPVGQPVCGGEVLLSAETREQPQQLGTGEVLVERELTGQVADPAAQCDRASAEVLVEQQYLPAGGADEVDEQPKRRGPARPVRAER
jgi:2-polyprenyl-6-methoxyphenol hydroxylase-like FAD-dependent oxidoreductase